MASVIICLLAIGAFSRTAGAENVRWVQILLLFAAGMNAGVALVNALGSRAPEATPP